MGKGAQIHLSPSKATAATAGNTTLAALLGATTQPAIGGEGIQQIKLQRLMSYQDPDGNPQRFAAYSPERLEELAESIGQIGVLAPLVVRPQNGVYQILAGHNRRAAAKLAGLDEVPCIVRECSNAEAKLIVNASNLCQRHELSLREKAFGYRDTLEAIAAMGLNNNRTMAVLEESTSENRRQIYRYIRLTHLIPELLDLVDRQEIPANSGMALSFLRQESQDLLVECMSQIEGMRQISLVQADELKKSDLEAPLTAAKIIEILTSRPPRVNLFNEFSKRSKNVFPKDATSEDITAIVEIIKNYFEQNRRDAG